MEKMIFSFSVMQHGPDNQTYSSIKNRFLRMFEVFGYLSKYYKLI